jgi:hypothetical protein
VTVRVARPADRRSAYLNDAVSFGRAHWLRDEFEASLIAIVDLLAARLAGGAVL